MDELFILPKSLLPSSDIIARDNKLPQRTVLISGITGQDGLYLTAFLLFNQSTYNYRIHGIVRKNSATLHILNALKQYLEDQKYDLQSITLHYGDMTDSLFIYQTIDKVKPDEVYNLAAQTHVQHSFQMSNHTIDVNLNGLLNICQSIVQLKLFNTRVFHASTSEMFGQIDPSQDTNTLLMNESFPFNPASPYAVSKISAYYLLRYYRNVYKLKICTAFSFNHESPLRHDQFITRKITKGVARIKLGLQQKIKLGNLYALRDWGHALDFVRAFWYMLNKQSQDQEIFQDFVVATEYSISVKGFMLQSFKEGGFNNIEFIGDGINEKLIDKNTGRILAEVDPEYIRPGEVPFLKGTYKKIKEQLGWEPLISIDQLIKEMIEYDLKIANIELSIKHRYKL